MVQNKKSAKLILHLKPEQKMIVRKFAENYQTSMSGFIKQALFEFIRKKEEEKALHEQRLANIKGE